MKKQVEQFVKQIIVIGDNPFTQEEGEKAFKNWMFETGSSEEDGLSMMFGLPPLAAIAMLNVHLEKK